MKKFRLVFLGLLPLFLFVVIVWFIQTHPGTYVYISDSVKAAGKNLAAVFFRESISVSELNQKYKSSRSKVNILIVPGHEPNQGGTQFGKVKERDLGVRLADHLSAFLENDTHYNVQMTRDEDDWNPIFSKYFQDNWNAIISFVAEQRSKMQGMMNVGTVKTFSGAYHAVANQDVALRLYGINKWANENDIDIELHVHFNDYPRKKQTLPGEYTGVTIYVPESQYSNSAATRAIASTVLSRLGRYNAISNQPQEVAGVVEDQDLIAVGSNNNADAASMVIEYGYIYEPQFQDADVRDLALKDLAYQTFLGLEDFFGAKTAMTVNYDTLILPYKWQKTFGKTSAKTKDVLALQSALVVDGEYLNGDVSKNDCPRSGYFGECTTKALSLFQIKYDIKGEKGMVGTKTLEKLNSLFGI